ncbi:MAG: Tat (Twin-arginine translocation) pathway signal sequence [Polaromonas sp.]|nr:Tat (Twin-arginine translocation) pathway signal sequence [Polaromonas sp.]
MALPSRLPDVSLRFSQRQQTRSLPAITRFSRLHFDLAVPRAENTYRCSGADSTLFQKCRLAPIWQALLEKYPDHFLAASDWGPPVAPLYRTAMVRQRDQILAPLAQAARHRIAYASA